MAMNIPMPSGENGDYLDDIRYDAKAARWSRTDYNRDTGTRDKTDLIEPFSLAVDFAGGEYGWIQTRNGFSLHLVPIGQPFPPKPPGDDHKRGFRFKVYRTDLGLRRFLQTSTVVIEVFDRLHTEWEQQAASHPGQIPVIQIDRAIGETVQARGGSQTVYRPQIRIVQWVPRPPAMTNGATPAAQPGNPGAAAATVPAQSVVPPPQPPAGPAPNEFA